MPPVVECSYLRAEGTRQEAGQTDIRTESYRVMHQEATFV
jgi:hypothetical protein